MCHPEITCGTARQPSDCCAESNSYSTCSNSSCKILSPGARMDRSFWTRLGRFSRKSSMSPMPSLEPKTVTFGCWMMLVDPYWKRIFWTDEDCLLSAGQTSLKGHRYLWHLKNLKWLQFWAQTFQLVDFAILGYRIWYVTTKNRGRAWNPKNGNGEE